MEKKLEGNYTRILQTILNQSWRQHPTKQQLYGHLLPITKTIKVRRTRHAGHRWRSKGALIRDVLLWAPSHGPVPIRDVDLETCQKQWTIEKGSEKGSGISVLMVRPDDDDDDDDDIYIYHCLESTYGGYYLLFGFFV